MSHRHSRSVHASLFEPLESRRLLSASNDLLTDELASQIREIVEIEAAQAEEEISQGRIEATLNVIASGLLPEHVLGLQRKGGSVDAPSLMGPTLPVKHVDHAAANIPAVGVILDRVADEQVAVDPNPDPSLPSPIPEPLPNPNPGISSEVLAGFDLVGEERLYPGSAVHAYALDHTDFGGGSDQFNATFDWDFGDQYNDYNELTGWNAAHVYTLPGKYTITLTVTDRFGNISTHQENVEVQWDDRRMLYVSNNGDDRHDGSTPSKAIASIDRLRQLLQTDSRVFLERGSEWTVNSFLDLPANTLLTWYGSGDENPVLRYRTPAAGENVMDDAILRTWKGVRNVVVREITLGGWFKAQSEDEAAWNSPMGAQFYGVNNTLHNVTFETMHRAIHTTVHSHSVLILDSVAPYKNSLFEKFIWGENRGLVMLGNYVANSVGSHVARITEGVNNVLIAHNSFNNPNTDIDTRWNMGSLLVQTAEDVYVAQNELLGGAVAFGPLAESGHENATASDIVFENNRSYRIDLHHGLSNAYLRGNLITVDEQAAIALTGWSSDYQRGLKNIQIDYNVVHHLGSNGNLVSLWNEADPVDPAQVSLRHNTFYGEDTWEIWSTPIMLFNGDDLRSFDVIEHNRYYSPNLVADPYTYGVARLTQEFLDIFEWQEFAPTDQIVNLPAVPDPTQGMIVATAPVSSFGGGAGL